MLKKWSQDSRSSLFYSEQDRQWLTTAAVQHYYPTATVMKIGGRFHKTTRKTCANEALFCQGCEESHRTCACTCHPQQASYIHMLPNNQILMLRLIGVSCRLSHLRGILTQHAVPVDGRLGRLHVKAGCPPLCRANCALPGDCAQTNVEEVL